MGLLLVASLVLQGAFFFTPYRADAAVTVVEVGPMVGHTAVIAADTRSLVVKEYTLDNIAYLTTQTLMRALIAQIINWVNTGLDGNPFYVTNTEAHFRGIADGVFNRFLTELGVLGVDPLVQRSLARSYNPSFQRAIRPTVSEAEISAFTNNFANGGWSMWIATLQPQNNPYGRFLIASDELQRRRTEAALRESQKLAWSGGFLSQEECLEIDSSGNCIFSSVNTPGLLIQDELRRALGTTFDELLAADELSEIIAAVSLQLFSTVFGGSSIDTESGRIRSGLRGVNTRPLVSQGANLPGISTIKDNLANEIRPLVRVEGNYQNRKNISLVLLNKVKETVVGLAPFHESLDTSGLSASALSKLKDLREKDGAYASTTIANTLDPRITQLENDIALSQQILNELDQLLADLAGTNTLSGIIAIANRYNEIINRVHTNLDEFNAQREFDELTILASSIEKEVEKRKDAANKVIEEDKTRRSGRQ